MSWQSSQFDPLDDAENQKPRSLRHNAFTNEFNAGYWPIYACVMSIVPNRNDADDVMQDVAIVMWEKFDEFEPGSSFIKWGRSIAYRLSKAFVRKKLKSSGCGLDEEIMRKITQIRSGASELLELRRMYLDECLDKMKPVDRKFLFACENRHGSVAEQARQQQKPAHQLYDRLSRLRQRLAKCVQSSLVRRDES
ncbi:sigma-70 family RNA polymerase sigma factor [Calycomorphotria hydatis]|uniref:RNA polymerase sigma factor n=1 Tax=Calycomorphotria hydatis TaxID=2528027 RepID=A0A517T3G3_9PLAN|nr:sigma-70 family RNA polymerase sigma factor [Calycomorphotria hydatis]QDT62917.1 RNA polymerase sigma factor [Calycomorphotria hydatis]